MPLKEESKKALADALAEADRRQGEDGRPDCKKRFSEWVARVVIPKAAEVREQLEAANHDLRVEKSNDKPPSVSVEVLPGPRGDERPLPIGGVYFFLEQERCLVSVSVFPPMATSDDGLEQPALDMGDADGAERHIVEGISAVLRNARGL